MTQRELNQQLYMAASNGDIKKVKSTIKQGADVNYHNPDYWEDTPLITASQKGHVEVVSFLLQNHANPNSTNKDRRTPLHFAAGNGRTEIATLLINNGANLDDADVWKQTPLHSAAYKGRIEIATLLINNGANLDAADNKEDTPLMLTCQQEHQSIALLLLEKGADKQLCNKNGDTALTLAKKKAQDFYKKVFDQTDQIEKNKSILLQALDEGYVILSIIKLLLVGPPAVGKTSFKHLLFDWEPPHHHHSTAVADRPIRAVERVATLDGTKSWEMVDTNALMQMLAEDIRVQASVNIMEGKQHPLPSIMKKETPVSISEIVKGKETQHSGIPSYSMTPETHLVISREQRTTATFAFYSSKSKINQSENGLPKELCHPTRISDGVKEECGPLQPITNTKSLESETFATKIAKKDSVLQLSKDILNAMSGKASRQLSQSTWIYILDSGGQPQFADVSRAFVRGNTVIVIVHKLTDRLSSKPIFQYSIDGKPLTQPKELRMTNIQLITTYVRSISSAKLAAVDGDDNESLPIFLIIGTYEDKMRGLGKLFRESLKKKNAQLIAALHKYKDQLIFYNECEQELIFPVDNMCLKNRQNLSSLVRTYIIGHKKAVVKKKVPIRWYVLESNIKDEGEKNDHGIVSRTQCQDIGQTLGMTKAQIQGAISFFKSLSVFLHFNTCSHLVFTNPKYFLDALSNIIRISFVDFPQTLLQKGKILPPIFHRRLREEGLFTIDLLDLLSIQFAPGLFEQADLLRLLCDLCIVAEVHRDDSTYYFIPTALSPKHLTANEKKNFSKTCEPLVLSFQHGVVPQGVFPAAVVALLNRKWPPLFTLECLNAQFPCQLRFAVKLQSSEPRGSLLLVDTMLWMEIYWTGDPAECSTFRSLVTAAINFCAQPLAYHPSALKCNPGTLCNLKHNPQQDMPPVHVALVTVNKRKEVKVSCTIQDLPPLELSKNFQPWMEGFEKEDVNKVYNSTTILKEAKPEKEDFKEHNYIATNLQEQSMSDTFSQIDYENLAHVTIDLENKLDILRLLHPIRYKWRQIGQSLKISHGDLENICDERSRNSDRLSDVIQIWFDKKTTDITWDTIKIAIELPPVLEPSIAESIMHFFSSINNN